MEFRRSKDPEVTIAHLLLPTPELVLAMADRFDKDERYGPADKVLSGVFSRHPLNEVLEDILIKVVLLNRLYNTNVFAVMKMAQHIRGLHIDEELKQGSPALVHRIEALTLGGKTRRHYSFASKYCSWHKPDAFPMYDSLVERVLILYRDQYAFAE